MLEQILVKAEVQEVIRVSNTVILTDGVEHVIPPQTNTEIDKLVLTGKLIRNNNSVKAGPQLALFDQHPEHPGGEVRIYTDGQAHQVAKTNEVIARLRDGRLIEIPAA